jgi:uncharacterized protein (TIGR02466 family)
MAVKAWFPTLVYEAPLIRAGGQSLRRALLGDCYKIRDHDEAGQRWCRKNYPAGFTSYASMCKLHETFSTFRELEKRVRRHVTVFVRHLQMDLGEGRLAMTDCWVNIMPRHAVHPLHLHPNSVISGTYYVKTPRGCSRIRFEDPRLASFMGAPPKAKDVRPENRQQVSYSVNAEHIVLFESWLRHEVVSNQTETERVSISFNYGWLSTAARGIERAT